MLYFRATEDLRPRKVNTSGMNWRTVFKAYAKKTDPSKISYYRHAGLRWQFVNLDGEWFCELTPDYFYSYDGHKESKFTAKYLSGIKRLERNAAVLQETRMWASILRGEETLLNQRSTILDFGDLVTFPVDRGLDDAAWKRAEEHGDAEPTAETLFEASA